MSHVHKLVGQRAVWQNLCAYLQKREGIAIAALTGMGGVGKTELALQYAHTKSKKYPAGIGWFQASLGNLGLQIAQFGRVELGLELPEDLDLVGQAQWVWARWRPSEGRALLVFDDVVSCKEFQEYLPAETRFHVICTTQLQTLSLGFEHFHLNVLKLDEALQLLQSLVGIQRINPELEAAKSICEWLGYLPLGLELVGHYLLESQDLLLAEMLEELSSEKLSQAGLEEPANLTTAKRGVRSVFELSWRKLSTDAQLLGCFLGSFASGPIPWELVELAVSTDDTKLLRQTRDRELIKRSLIERKRKGIYQLHQLIREFFQEKLETHLEVQGIKKGFAKAMLQQINQIPELITLAHINKFAPLIPHFQVVTQMECNYLDEENTRVYAFVGLGRFYQGQGQYSSAEPWYQRGLDFARRCFGSEHPDMASVLNELAVLYRVQEKYEKAESSYQQALKIRRKVLGKYNFMVATIDHLNLATTLGNLAFLHNIQGKNDESEALYFESFEMTKKALNGVTDGGQSVTFVDLSFCSQWLKVLATNTNNLAGLYRAQGHFDKAENLYFEALELKRRNLMLSEDTPEVAQTLHDLASLYYKQEKYKEAKTHYLKALKIWKSTLGEDHYYVGSASSGLAEVYHRQENYEEAEKFYLRSYEIKRESLGESHSAVVGIASQLASLYKERKKYHKAEQLYIQLLESLRNYPGENNADNLMSISNNLAGVYTELKKYKEAENLYFNVLEMDRKNLGAEHPDTGTTLNNMASLYLKQMDYEKAESLFVQAWEIFGKSMSSNCGVELAKRGSFTLANLAFVYQVQGKYKEAEQPFIHALYISAHYLGEASPETQILWQRLVQFIRQVHQTNQPYVLSDHPLTQNILQQISQDKA